ncbi:MAG: competence/damage-inducible protein A [Spirochaetes bacterium]|nr:competence/damage-inducible protein A [Spirochaetota bacterium]MBN2770959.1 competence/damage-inducible protein A [Spirochaetota bacterium]
MKCSIVTIGTEILLGDIINTNSAYLSRKLAEHGIAVFSHHTVGDNPDRIQDTFKTAFKNCDTVITTGGLGPTEDDITREAVARFLGLELASDAKAQTEIAAFFEQRGRSMSPSNLKQAMFPEGSIICHNSRGTAPGAIASSNGKTVIMLPGPPFELELMFQNSVLPYIEKISSQVFRSRVIHFSDIGESEMNDRVKDLLDGKNPTVAPYAKTSGCQLRITAGAKDHDYAMKLIKPLEDEIVNRLPEYIYGYDDDTLESRAAELLKKLSMTISCAESCTGGMLSSTLVNYAGISDVFAGSVISYSNAVKIQELSVEESILEKNGAVSEECARAMVIGCAQKFNTDVAISITGIAGPGGATDDKPVGTVYTGLYINGQVSIRKLNMFGDRQRIRLRTVNSVLFNLVKELEKL